MSFDIIDSMKIVAVNASPRDKWNTANLVNEAAEGAKSTGADVKVFNLYDLEKYTGCVSCFGCKLGKNTGKCIHKDGLTEILEEIHTSDGLIIGTPNYLSDVTASFRALYERLIFQYITYKTEPKSYNDRSIPVLMIMTSNVSEDFYPQIGYEATLEKYRQTFSNFIGPAKILISGDTLQVNDYDKFNWTLFDPVKKKERHETEFPKELKKAFEFGKDMAENRW